MQVFLKNLVANQAQKWLRTNLDGNRPMSIIYERSFLACYKTNFNVCYYQDDIFSVNICLFIIIYEKIKLSSIRRGLKTITGNKVCKTFCHRI